MKFWLVARVAIGLTVVAGVPGVALAQAGWTPGSEIVGQSIQVTTNGVTNTVYLDPGGAARIISPAGNTVAGTWTAVGRATVPEHRRRDRMLALHRAVPGRAAADSDQQLQLDVDLAGLGDQHAGAARGASAASKPQPSSPVFYSRLRPSGVAANRLDSPSSDASWSGRGAAG